MTILPRPYDGDSIRKAVSRGRTRKPAAGPTTARFSGAHSVTMFGKRCGSADTKSLKLLAIEERPPVSKNQMISKQGPFDS
jgi:hypothetical protein